MDDFEIVRKQIEKPLRRIGKTWTVETQSEVVTDYHIDVEEELAEALRQEINLEIIADLRRADAPRIINTLAPIHPRELLSRTVKITYNNA